MAEEVYKLLAVVDAITKKSLKDNEYYDVTYRHIGGYFVYDRDKLRSGAFKHFGLRGLDGYPVVTNHCGEVRNIYDTRQRGREFMVITTELLDFRFYRTGLTPEEYLKRKEDT